MHKHQNNQNEQNDQNGKPKPLKKNLKIFKPKNASDHFQPLT